jgi:uncharacterized protein YjbI with pentapeptide repeats
VRLDAKLPWLDRDQRVARRTLLAAAALAVAGAVVTICVLAFIKWIPDALVPKHGQPPGRADEIAKVRSALLTMMGGLVAVAGAIYTVKTFRLSRQGQITDRLTRAIDQLGSDHVDIRLGGIYALERLARESSGDYGQIIEILAGYIREKSRWIPSSTPPPSDVDELRAALRPRADIHAALRAIGRRDAGRDQNSATVTIDLSHTDLRGVAFDGGNFSRALFVEAHLECADLAGADLSGIDASSAHLDHAKLSGAILIDAKLESAQLPHAELRFAKMRKAKLRDANLEHANLFEADLDHADLWKAKLHRANLWNTKLATAELREADISGIRENAATTWPADRDSVVARSIVT